MIDFGLILIDFRSFVFYHLFLYKEDRHVALTARSAVNATWRGSTGVRLKLEPRCAGMVAGDWSLMGASKDLQTVGWTRAGRIVESWGELRMENSQ